MKQLSDLFSQIHSMQKNMGQFSQSPQQPFDFSSIDSFIQDTMNQALGQNAPIQKQQSIPIESEPSEQYLDYELVELHHYYVLKLTIPSHIDVEAIRLSLGNCRLYVHGLPSGKTQTIPLQEQPHPKQVHAQFKDGILEVRLTRTSKEQTQDIYIQY